MALVVAAARPHPRPPGRRRARAVEPGLHELLVPLVKGLSTEMGLEILLALGVTEVHGGMGFIEETGAAQYLRDAIPTIYEGTTAIQANEPGRPQTARDGVHCAMPSLAIDGHRRLEGARPPGRRMQPRTMSRAPGRSRRLRRRGGLRHGR